MKRILYVAVSAIGFGAVVLAQTLIKRKVYQKIKSRNEKDAVRKDVNAEQDQLGFSGMSVKMDGSLNMHRNENRKSTRKETATRPVVHLKKNGEPDRRYRENRDL